MEAGEQQANQTINQSTGKVLWSHHSPIESGVPLIHFSHLFCRPLIRLPPHLASIHLPTAIFTIFTIINTILSTCILYFCLSSRSLPLFPLSKVGGFYPSTMVYPGLRTLPRDTEGGSTVYAGKQLTTGSFVSSISLAMIAITVVSFCLARRLITVRNLRDLPLARWC